MEFHFSEKLFVLQPHLWVIGSASIHPIGAEYGDVHDQVLKYGLASISLIVNACRGNDDVESKFPDAFVALSHTGRSVRPGTRAGPTGQSENTVREC